MLTRTLWKVAQLSPSAGLARSLTVPCRNLKLTPKRLFGSVKPQVAKPRAKKSNETGQLQAPTRARNVALGVLGLGILGAGGYFLVTEWDSVLDYIQDTHEPDKALMKEALPPAHAQNGMVTIIVSLDGTVLLKTWNPKYGFRYMKRDGMEEFLSNLAQQGYEVIFWTDTALAGGFEIFEKLLSSVPSLPFRGMLAREHMYPSDSGKKLKKIKDLPRNLNNVVLIDWDLENVKGQEDNVIIVPKMKAEDEEGDESEDRTLKVLGKFFQTFSDEFRKGNATDMRSFIRRYNRDNDGHGVSEETVAKMLDNISKEMEERLKAEMERKTTGLGGMVRKLQSSSALVQKGKAITPTTYSADSTTVEGSLLSARVEKMRREAEERRKKFEAKQRGEQE